MSSEFFLHGIRDVFVDDLAGQFAEPYLQGMPDVGMIPYRDRSKVLHVPVLVQNDSFGNPREEGNGLFEILEQGKRKNLGCHLIRAREYQSGFWTQGVCPAQTNRPQPDTVPVRAKRGLGLGRDKQGETQLVPQGIADLNDLLKKCAGTIIP